MSTVKTQSPNVYSSSGYSSQSLSEATAAIDKRLRHVDGVTSSASTNLMSPPCLSSCSSTSASVSSSSAAINNNPTLSLISQQHNKTGNSSTTTTTTGNYFSNNDTISINTLNNNPNILLSSHSTSCIRTSTPTSIAAAALLAATSSNLNDLFSHQQTSTPNAYNQIDFIDSSLVLSNRNLASSSKSLSRNMISVNRNDETDCLSYCPYQQLELLDVHRLMRSQAKSTPMTTASSIYSATSNYVNVNPLNERQQQQAQPPPVIRVHSRPSIHKPVNYSSVHSANERLSGNYFHQYNQQQHQQHHQCKVAMDEKNETSCVKEEKPSFFKAFVAFFYRLLSLVFVFRQCARKKHDDESQRDDKSVQSLEFNKQESTPSSMSSMTMMTCQSNATSSPNSKAETFCKAQLDHSPIYSESRERISELALRTPERQATSRMIVTGQAPSDFYKPARGAKHQDEHMPVMLKLNLAAAAVSNNLEALSHSAKSNLVSSTPKDDAAASSRGPVVSVLTPNSVNGVKAARRASRALNERETYDNVPKDSDVVVLRHSQSSLVNRPDNMLSAGTSYASVVSSKYSAFQSQPAVIASSSDAGEDEHYVKIATGDLRRLKQKSLNEINEQNTATNERLANHRFSDDGVYMKCFRSVHPQMAAAAASARQSQSLTESEDDETNYDNEIEALEKALENHVFSHDSSASSTTFSALSSSACNKICGSYATSSSASVASSSSVIVTQTPSPYSSAKSASPVPQELSNTHAIFLTNRKTPASHVKVPIAFSGDYKTGPIIQHYSSSESSPEKCRVQKRCHFPSLIDSSAAAQQKRKSVQFNQSAEDANDAYKHHENFELIRHKPAFAMMRKQPPTPMKHLKSGQFHSGAVAAAKAVGRKTDASQKIYAHSMNQIPVVYDDYLCDKEVESYFDNPVYFDCYAKADLTNYSNLEKYSSVKSAAAKSEQGHSLKPASSNASVSSQSQSNYSTMSSSSQGSGSHFKAPPVKPIVTISSQVNSNYSLIAAGAGFIRPSKGESYC